MNVKTLLAAATLVGLAGAAQAAELTRVVGAPTAAIASLVVAPAGSDIAYVSGTTPPPVTPAAGGAPAVYGDTKTQTIGILTRISELLKAQGMSMKDVAMMRVYLVADPAKDNKMDFAGMNDGFKQFFGTADQPNKPARTTVQVAALAGPQFLVEIEAQAVKTR